MPVVVVLLASLLSVSAVAAPSSFRSAKKTLSTMYQAELPLKSVYCGCDFEAQGKKLVPQLADCGYQIRKQQTRATRIEWEHVMPAWQFGHQLQCWQQGGRKNCRKDKRFKAMEADMHNLYPAIGEVNGDRSNYAFSDWNGRPTQYGRCEMVVDFKARKVQPPQRARGQIARSYLYMAEHYRINLSKSQQRLYSSWHTMYPATESECKRHRLVSSKQGWSNPYIAQQCT
ncbi:endonuclease [Ferrimonas lipolytica]|uniref:Deoxyribonuclease n=1 Tax=Ferrimonas lipolytica TaxID=2724191 RepID=A0A6H1U904_9GAMM|nr:endonuclease [Ferrimonas lipolytica]QIZ75521.1 deoxyribonuclease [Ferrimonas lipolytica]